MKRKWICLLLAAALLLTLFPALALPALAEGEMQETFTANGAATVQGQHITVSSDGIDDDGWYGGSNFTLTVQAEKGYIITDIEAKIGSYGYKFGGVVIDHGTKQEKGSVEDGDTVHFDGVNFREFHIPKGGDVTQLKELTVYYREEVVCDTDGHQWENGVCSVCKQRCNNGFHKRLGLCPDCRMSWNFMADPGTASVFSEGNVTILACIACAAVFGLGGYLMGRRQRPAKR